MQTLPVTLFHINEYKPFFCFQKKNITFNIFYSEIEQIILEELRNEYYITIQLKNVTLQSQQKCFLVECLDLEDFAHCIEYFSPKHATWLNDTHSWRHRKVQSSIQVTSLSQCTHCSCCDSARLQATI